MRNDEKLTGLLEVYPALSPLADGLCRARDMIVDTYRRGGKIMVLGNGGSSADADHIVGELMKGFLLKRRMTERQRAEFRAALGEAAEGLSERLQRGIPAISLTAQSAVLSAFANDVDPELVYAQMVFGYGKPSDLVIAISTSGNAKNAVSAVMTAKAMGIKTLGLTGEGGGRLSELCDLTLRAPERETYRVQELHLPIYHYLCASAEEEIFGEDEE